ncbi:MAG: DUF721 domain-containing protein [Bacteroidales bacterium]|nr:DUF721 domain-containing protein [Bacteroidales bacterium]
MATFRIRRKNALPLSAAIKEYLQEARMTTGMNNHLVFKAWDEVSGAAQFTIKRFFRNGKLYITTNSSVVSSQLSRQKDFLLEKLNDRLARDEFFEPEDRNASWVEDIILK